VVQRHYPTPVFEELFDGAFLEFISRRSAVTQQHVNVGTLEVRQLADVFQLGHLEAAHVLQHLLEDRRFRLGIVAIEQEEHFDRRVFVIRGRKRRDESRHQRKQGENA
jgi:hypothetical protein